MATRQFAVTRAPNGARNCIVVQWAGLLNGDDGAPYEAPGDFNDRTVQIAGTFGAGGTIVFEGGNVAGSYLTLTDPQGNAISKTAAALEVMEEAPRYMRPRVTGGDGTTNLAVTMLIRRNR